MANAYEPAHVILTVSALVNALVAILDAETDEEVLAARVEAHLALEMARGER